MAKGTGINWVENADGERGTTINPIQGCSKDGRPDCAHCWAEHTSNRLKRMGIPQYQDGITDNNGRWTGKVRFEPGQLAKLLRGTKPQPIFMESMGDLFHENVPQFWQQLVFGCMALTPQNFYYILTKRTSIARDFLASLDIQECLRIVRDSEVLDYVTTFERIARASAFYEQEQLPDVLRNTIIGSSCGITSGLNRVDPLYDIRTMGWQTWISAEPLIEHVDFGFDVESGRVVDWMVVGGESNQGKLKAREFMMEWAFHVQMECKNNNIPFWFKQLGSFPTFGGKRHPATGQGEKLEEIPEKLRDRQRPLTALKLYSEALHRYENHY